MKVYWAPVNYNLLAAPKDSNMFYYDPRSLLSILNDSRNKETDVSNFFRCPTVTGLTKNIFILENPLETNTILDRKTNKFKVNNNMQLKFTKPHEPSIGQNLLFTHELQWIFFTEEPSLKMTLTSPFFSYAPHTQYGSIVPGSFDIGKWFRNINLEFNIWNDKDELHIKEGEPLAYVHFDTDKTVELIRFNLNTQLKTYIDSIAKLSSYEPRVPLLSRYERFKRTRMKDLIMKEIKANIVDNTYNI
jgi:hypothetical protein